MELRNALESEDPTEYLSSLPVHQDGTCNGLQHYAALGGDDHGAKQVNLAAADRPSDVYTHVSSEVQKAIDIDAAKGQAAALLLNGRISRKVVKQTVCSSLIFSLTNGILIQCLFRSIGHDNCVRCDFRGCSCPD